MFYLLLGYLFAFFFSFLIFTLFYYCFTKLTSLVKLSSICSSCEVQEIKDTYRRQFDRYLIPQGVQNSVYQAHRLHHIGHGILVD